MSQIYLWIAKVICSESIGIAMKNPETRRPAMAEYAYPSMNNCRHSEHIYSWEEGLHHVENNNSSSATNKNNNHCLAKILIQLITFQSFINLLPPNKTQRSSISKCTTSHTSGPSPVTNGTRISRYRRSRSPAL